MVHKSNTGSAEKVVVYSVERESTDASGEYVSERTQLMRDAANRLPTNGIAVDMGNSFIGGMHFTDAERAKFLDGLDDSIDRLKAMSKAAVTGTLAPDLE